MKAAFVQLGQAIDFVPSRDVAAGEILVCNGMAGVAKLPVKAGELGSLHLSGVYDIDKAPVAINAVHPSPNLPTCVTSPTRRSFPDDTAHRPSGHPFSSHPSGHSATVRACTPRLTRRPANKTLFIF